MHSVLSRPSCGKEAGEVWLLYVSLLTGVFVLLWKYLEFGACETATVQLSSLLFIMSDMWEVKNLNTFLREQWSYLTTQLGNQLGAYESSFLKETETSTANSFFISFQLISLFYGDLIRRNQTAEQRLENKFKKCRFGL